MAKTSSVEKNNRRRRLAAQYAAKRKRLKAIADDLKQPGGRALCGAHQACRDAAQLLADAHPQPLRAHGPRARLLPQAQGVPQQASRTGQPGPDPRHDQVELVREGCTHVNERSLRRYADPHPQCADAAASQGRDSGVQLRARVLDVLVEEGYIRGYARVEQKGASAGVRDRAQVLQRPAGHPRDQARLKPGRRVYSPVRDLPTVANGLGVAILSTPKGVMSDSRAREENVGGEILCNVF